jgi:uncharacterized protein DUF4260
MDPSSTDPMTEGAPTAGVVTGRPLAWLRVEGLSVAGAALAVFASTGQPWWWVPALLLVPDVSWLAYLAGPTAGAWVYNLAHSMTLSLVLLGAGVWWHSAAVTVAGAIGLLHLGIDRLMTYGFKYDHDFGVTHLGVNRPRDHHALDRPGA